MDSLLQFIENHNALFLFYVFVTSASIGSFLNVVIFRLPIKLDSQWAEDVTAYLSSKNIQIKPIPVKKEFANLSDRSKCPHCQTPIPFYRNIPIFGWLLLKGRSACCGTPISIRYFLIELFCAISVTFLFYKHEPAYALFASGILLTLVPLFFIDMEKQLLPFDIMIYTFVISVIYFAFALNDAQTYIITATAVYCGFIVFAAAYKILRGFDGLGQGDMVLISILSAIFGVANIPILLLLSVIFTFVLYLFKIIKKDSTYHGVEGAMPFGPGICAAAALLIYLGENFNFMSILA